MKVRINRNNISVFVLMSVAFVLTWLICTLFNISPFVSYDDYHLYFNYRPDNIESVRYYLEQRQIFAVFAAYLNEFLFVDEWINGTRLFNIIIGFLTVLEYGKLCDRIGYRSDKKRIMLILAISPLIIFWMGSLYKDGLCAYLTVKLINVFADLIVGKNIRIVTTVTSIIVLYFVRTGVVEVLLVFAFLYYMRYNRSYVKYVIALLAIVLGLSLFLEYSKVYLDVLGHKFDGYIYAETVDTGMLGLIRINSLTDFWKLPLCALFLQVSPIPTTEIVDTAIGIGWWNVISYTSIIQFFLVPFFWYYVFKVNKCVLEKFVLLFYIFWLCFIAVTELNIVRFYVFVMPLFYVFGIHGLCTAKGRTKKVLLCVSMGFIFMWLMLVIRSFMQ